ncbi:3-keto-disaccharide hydrolase [Chryseolinea lacunae]|uniref:DUF1080 domain-containing protein n=1 Tax=Chryseolinea lacunae TaxID=2801331 RepID=A0ABS1L1G5_9BACT|nr:DUF1080 domain-containing protein [Chryseolinea lacunae]MBL0745526.1 DUF1080 domain-containing protein [Chryseolinea lacunae]
MKSIRQINALNGLALGLLVLAMASGCKKPAETQQAATVDSAAGDGFVSIFDGKTLANWEGDTTYWRVENGNLVGEVTPTTLLKTNTFIVWQGGTPGDFELKLEFRIADAGNSGVNYRSEKVSDVPHALRGYQADIDGKINYTGQNYEERGRTTLAYRGETVTVSTQPNPNDAGSLQANVKNNAWSSREVTASLGTADSLKTLIKHEDWNTCHIIAKGNHLQHYINGVLMSDVTDSDTVNQKLSGLLGVQVHVGPPMKVEYRDIRLKQ